MVLELQYFILVRTCNDKTCRQLMSLDPAQLKIYFYPIAEEDIFIPGYTHAMLDRYAQAILEVGFLSLSTAQLLVSLFTLLFCWFTKSSGLVVILVTRDSLVFLLVLTHTH